MNLFQTGIFDFISYTTLIFFFFNSKTTVTNLVFVFVFVFFCLVLNIYFYVFIWLHPVSVVARGMFSGVMGDLFLLSCGMQVLVP